MEKLQYLEIIDFRTPKVEVRKINKTDMSDIFDNKRPHFHTFKVLDIKTFVV